MDSQGPLRDIGATNPIDVSTTNPLAVGTEFRVQGSSIPPAPFFQGFPHHGSQMSFLFPHSFMPPLPGVGFAPPNQGGPSGNIDLTAGSQKRASQECVTNQSKSTKKRRVAQKKPEIVELDDVKDEVEVLKSGGHWKDHWVIQLISIRGEMYNNFSAPPKQGNILFFFFLSPLSTSPTHSLCNVFFFQSAFNIPCPAPQCFRTMSKSGRIQISLPSSVKFACITFYGCP